MNSFHGFHLSLLNSETVLSISAGKAFQREEMASAKVLHYNNTKHVRKSKEAGVGNRTH